MQVKLYISFVGKIRDTTSGRECKQSIIMNLCNMEIECRYINCVFNGQSAFSMLLTLIENSHFHFLLILDRGVISRQTCDNWTFSLHIQLSN